MIRWRRHLGLLVGGAAVAVSVVAAGAAPLLTPYGWDEQHLEAAFHPPTPVHPFGTDDLGRDVLTRVLYGGRYTLALAGSVVALAGLAGMLIGAFSGYVGGWADEGVMRATGLVNAGLAMGLVWWPPYARLARGEVLAVRTLEYVEAAAAIGQTPWGIFRRTILPNVLPGMVVLATIDLGAAIVTGAGLSFLGLGATPPAPEWGAMVSAGRELLAQWWVATFPGLAIFLTVIAFNFVGDGIRDVLDPRRRGS